MNADKNARFTRWLMLALLAWGCLVALGTFLYRINRLDGNDHASHLPLYRGLIVLACTLGFLGLWLLAMAFRKTRHS